MRAKPRKKEKSQLSVISPLGQTPPPPPKKIPTLTGAINETMLTVTKTRNMFAS
jgi:hypothetical protein